MFSKKAAAPTVETLERHSQFVDIWRRFKRNKLAVFANFIAPYDPAAISTDRLASPAWST